MELRPIQQMIYARGESERRRVRSAAPAFPTVPASLGGGVQASHLSCAEWLHQLRQATVPCRGRWWRWWSAFIRRLGVGRDHPPKQSAQLAMADKSRGRGRAGEDCPLEGCVESAVLAGVRNRAAGLEKPEIVAGDPVPAQDDVQPRVQVERRHIDAFAQVPVRAQGETDADWRR